MNLNKDILQLSEAYTKLITTQSAKGWHVIKRQIPIPDATSMTRGYQLRFDDIPIMDYLLAEQGNIKELRTYGYNFLTKLPKDIKIPPILFLYSRAKDLEKNNLSEAMYLNRSGPKTIDRSDISNKLFELTDGGREICTVHTIRKNDSTTDPSKKAGQPMVVVGRLGSCVATRKASTYRVPELSTPVQYKKNAILRMCVSSIDGVDYTKTHKPEQRTRSFDVTTITRIEAGGETYHIV